MAGWIKPAAIVGATLGFLGGIVAPLWWGVFLLLNPLDPPLPIVLCLPPASFERFGADPLMVGTLYNGEFVEVKRIREGDAGWEAFGENAIEITIRRNGYLCEGAVLRQAPYIRIYDKLWEGR